ncbi:hypothetical protein [Streptomyces oceani]|uniref:Uncharacterized protein n=1 Tax=Streptomyces oceani TaxID=1075402 RepID=A0A1E7KND5_9ACTN|nr:hypothetical protein [Streptomyces oceani]OEV05455.1 hypothetical protein AN216_03040 [Streptomyces oceani]
MKFTSRAVRRAALAVGAAALVVPGTAAVATATSEESADGSSTDQALEVTREFYDAYVRATNQGAGKKAERLRERHLGNGLGGYAEEWRERHDEDFVLRSEAPTTVRSYAEAEVDEHEVRVTFGGDAPRTLLVTVDPETRKITQIAELLDSGENTMEYEVTEPGEKLHPKPVRG